MLVIKKIKQSPRNWTDIAKDLAKIKARDLHGHGQKLVKLLTRHNQPQLLEQLLSRFAIDLHFWDPYGRTVLHQAVDSQNEQVLEVLLREGGQTIVNQRDKLWLFGPLHWAVVNNDQTAVKLLLKYGADVNLKADHADLKQVEEDSRLPSRIRPLHLASLNGFFDLVKILVRHGARLGPHAEKTGLTSLFMAAREYCQPDTPPQKKQQLLKIVQYLLRKGANGAAVDYDGDSILYYSSIWRDPTMYKLFAPLINVNAINYNKDTILHHVCLLHNFKVSATEIAKQRPLLTRMNSFYINYPNLFDYDTLLHIYARNGMWKKMTDILSQKYLDIYITNRDGIRPIDYVAKGERPRFLQMAAKGYTWCLRNCPDVKPIAQWEKICQDIKKKQFSLAQLQKIVGSKSKDPEQLCILAASKIISKRSYPKLDHHIRLNITGKFKLNWWTATTFEIFFGLLYLMKKYSSRKVCFLHDFDFIKKGAGRHHSIGVLFEEQVHKFCFTWKNDVLKTNPRFAPAIKKCQSRFFVIPLALSYGASSDGHFNSLLIDRQAKTIERFEPHGYKSSWYHNHKLLDQKLAAVFKKIVPTYQYISPRQYITRIGFQGYDAVSKYSDITQFIDMGFCVVWSFWYLDLRIQNPDIPRNKLIEIALLKIHKKFTSNKKFIMTYANQILKPRDKLLKDCSISIDDYVSDNTTVQDVNCLLSRLPRIMNF